MIKRILIGLVAFFSLMVATLAIHIYLVTRPSEGAISSISMGRIDIHDTLDSDKVEGILSKVKLLDGVKDVRINQTSGHLICLYDRKSWSGDELTNWIADEFTVSASFFRPTEEMLSQSCPAIDKNTLTYKLGAFFQRVFEN